jgi:hypothetical protein
LDAQHIQAATVARTRTLWVQPLLVKLGVAHSFGVGSDRVGAVVGFLDAWFTGASPTPPHEG